MIRLSPRERFAAYAVWIMIVMFCSFFLAVLIGMAIVEVTK